MTLFFTNGITIHSLTLVDCKIGQETFAPAKCATARGTPAEYQEVEQQKNVRCAKSEKMVGVDQS